MPSTHSRGLWLHIAIPVLAFVVAGSLALVLWLHTDAMRESQNLFATLARTNADLIKSARLPGDERTASELGRVLNMPVFFRHGAWDLSLRRSGEMAARRATELVPLPTGELAPHRRVLSTLEPADGITPAGANHEAIAVEADDGLTLILVRKVRPATELLFRSRTITALSLFWLLAAGLVWALLRGIVRPLRLLADHLPAINSESRVLPPGVERSDEIGQLARAYLATRGQLKEERQRRTQSERLAMLGRMATGLAHEIHNPLAAIRLHAQLLDSAPREEFADTARESLPILLDETSRIEGLVNQWMFLARPVPPQTSSADLAEIVQAVVKGNKALAEHAGVRLSCSFPQSLFVNVDSRRIVQAVRNVIVNAIQAMANGGALTISGDRQGGNVRVTFSDTGPGFSPAALARYAELFFSEKEGGMGIGLSVSTEILKAHKGVLLVANGPAGGAVVTFLIPAP